MNAVGSTRSATTARRQPWEPHICRREWAIRPRKCETLPELSVDHSLDCAKRPAGCDRIGQYPIRIRRDHPEAKGRRPNPGDLTLVYGSAIGAHPPLRTKNRSGIVGSANPPGTDGSRVSANLPGDVPANPATGRAIQLQRVMCT